jgi:hypothetical protein
MMSWELAKNWKKVVEWMEEEWMEEDEEGKTFEERKKKEKIKCFSEYYFGGDGWHITTRP